MFTTASRSVSRVHCVEIALYDDYGVEEIMIDALGFGRPLDFEPWVKLPGAIASEFAGQIRYIADGLGVEVSEVRETYGRRLTDEPIETAFGDRRPRDVRRDHDRPRHPARPTSVWAGRSARPT